MTTQPPSPDTQEKLTGELSDLAIRIVRCGGSGALAACTVAMAEGAAAAAPAAMIPEFVRELVRGVARGAALAGHKVEVIEPRMPSGAVH